MITDNYSFMNWGDPFREYLTVSSRDPYRGFQQARFAPPVAPQTMGRRDRPREFIIPIHVEGRDEPVINRPEIHHHIDLTEENYNNNGVHNHSRTRRRHQSGSHHSSGKSTSSGFSHFALSGPSQGRSSSASKPDSSRLSDELIDLCMFEDMYDSDTQDCYIEESSHQDAKSSVKRSNSECLTGVSSTSSVEASSKSITPTPSYEVYKLLKSGLAKDGRLIDYIRGDGNCFFRALSKDIYGSEDFHEEVRQAVVDLIEKYSKEFEQFLDSDMPIADHIKDMRKDATWATSAEIYAAATLLQRDVYVLSPDHTGEAYNWMLFRPRFIYTRDTSYHPCFMTLCHTHGNHYDRITPREGKCNCDCDPPVLSGVQAYVDLTK